MAGVIIRSGGALENLGHATTLVMDKTGTLTMGRPAVVDVVAAPGGDTTELLRLAASVDQLSPHVLAEAIVTEALTPGSAVVTAHRCASKSLAAASPPPSAGAGLPSENCPRDTVTSAWARGVVAGARLDSAAIAWVCVEGEPAGAVLLRDPLRRHAPRTVRRLHAAGLNRLVMLTGDRAEPGAGRDRPGTR